MDRTPLKEGYGYCSSCNGLGYVNSRLIKLNPNISKALCLACIGKGQVKLCWIDEARGRVWKPKDV